MGRRVPAVLFFAWCATAGAQSPTIGDVQHYTENRGWNEAGLARQPLTQFYTL